MWERGPREAGRQEFGTPLHTCTGGSEDTPACPLALCGSGPPPSPLMSNTGKLCAWLYLEMQRGHILREQRATQVPTLSGCVKLVLTQNWTGEGKWAEVQGERGEGWLGWQLGQHSETLQKDF